MCDVDESASPAQVEGVGMIAKFAKVFILFSVILAIFFIIIYRRIPSAEEGDPIHIAAVGPIWDKETSEERPFIRGIRLYVDFINDSGGIEGRKIILDPF